MSKYCCLHFCRNRLGLMLAQEYFKGQWSSINSKLHFLWVCVTNMQYRVVTTWCAIKYPWCFTSYSLSNCCCLHFCRIRLGLMNILRVKGQALIPNCNFLWVCMTNVNHRVVSYLVRHQVSVVFFFSLIRVLFVSFLVELR